MKEAVLLLAHGAPERLEDVEEYVGRVRAGRPPAPAVVEEVRSRYAEIGGGSPLLARTRDQARALQSVLGVQVYFGMRNWHPFIAETMAAAAADKVTRLVAVCLAPQYSKLSVGLYFRRVQAAKQDLGMDTEILWTKSFHDHPLLIRAFADRLAPHLPAEKVLFTAHSLPEKILEAADPYDREVKATASLVAAAVGLKSAEFAYQSQGMTEDRWLGPTVESRLELWAREGVREVVLAPVGFVCDHIEILYDVDILFRRFAADRGIRLSRPESLNDSPTFISALAEVVRARLGAR